jgi:hypothetical protein
LGSRFREAAVDRNEHLRNAKECRAVAEHATSPEYRADFLRMAEMWEGLARNFQDKTLDKPDNFTGDIASH